MKKLVLLLGIIGLGFAGFSQGEAPLAKGEKWLNLGITGFGGSIPIYANMEWAVHKDVTLGPAVAVNLFSGNTALKAGFIANYHWNSLIGIPNNWDFYAGLNAGYKFDFDDSNKNDFAFGGQVGGRWFFSDKWGLNAEFGFSGAVGGGFGVTMKL